MSPHRALPEGEGPGPPYSAVTAENDFSAASCGYEALPSPHCRTSAVAPHLLFIGVILRLQESRPGSQAYYAATTKPAAPWEVTANSLPHPSTVTETRHRHHYKPNLRPLPCQRPTCHRPHADRNTLVPVPFANTVADSSLRTSASFAFGWSSPVIQFAGLAQATQCSDLLPVPSQVNCRRSEEEVTNTSNDASGEPKSLKQASQSRSVIQPAVLTFPVSQCSALLPVVVCSLCFAFSLSSCVV